MVIHLIIFHICSILMTAETNTYQVGPTYYVNTLGPVVLRPFDARPTFEIQQFLRPIC